MWGYFNPRPLAGATVLLSPYSKEAGFQSPPPCGGDFHSPHLPHCDQLISIHAPLRGRPEKIRGLEAKQYFNPRPLAGATTGSSTDLYTVPDFNPRPLAGATTYFLSSLDVLIISIHAPLRGRLNTS